MYVDLQEYIVHLLNRACHTESGDSKIREMFFVLRNVPIEEMKERKRTFSKRESFLETL